MGGLQLDLDRCRGQHPARGRHHRIEHLNDRGTATIGTAAAFLVFMLLMFTAVQVLFNLYANSVLTAAAHDAAREVAGFRSAEDRCGAVGSADAGFAADLGGYTDSGRAELRWTCTDPDVVRVRIVATHPTVLPPRLSRLLSLGSLDRTIEVRIEDDR